MNLTLSILRRSKCLPEGRTPLCQATDADSPVPRNYSPASVCLWFPVCQRAPLLPGSVANVDKASRSMCGIILVRTLVYDSPLRAALVEFLHEAGLEMNEEICASC